MEIRTYVNMVLRYWWLIVLTTVAAGVGAAAFDRLQPPTFHTSARVSLRPAPTVSDQRTIVDLLGQMGGRYITGTFAQAFTAAQVLAEARQAAGLSPQAAGDYNVDANILPDSAIVEVTGSGPNPYLLANYVNAVVAAGVRNTGTLFRVIDLVPLEPAGVPTAPASPSPSRDVPLAAGLGLALGVLLALALEYLRGPAPVVAPALVAAPELPAPAAPPAPIESALPADLPASRRARRALSPTTGPGVATVIPAPSGSRGGPPAK